MHLNSWSIAASIGIGRICAASASPSSAATRSIISRPRRRSDRAATDVRYSPVADISHYRTCPLLRVRRKWPIVIGSLRGPVIYWAEVKLGRSELDVNFPPLVESMRKSPMTLWRTMIITMLTFSSFLTTEVAAQNDFSDRRSVAKCNAQFRKCNSHCNLVYERGPGHRACRGRCKDALYTCKAKLH
jgi:hypothetical protein